MEISGFQNLELFDFSIPKDRQAMEEAIALIWLQLGRHYNIVIGGSHLKTEVVGPDARRTDTGHAEASAGRGNAEDGTAASVTRRTPGVGALWLRFSLSPMNQDRCPLPSLPGNRVPWQGTFTMDC